MPIRNCTSCNKPMNADLSKCPWCGAAAIELTLAVPGSPEGTYVQVESKVEPSGSPPPPTPVVPATQPPKPAPETMPCPYCQEPVRKDAVKCRWCGEGIAGGKALPPPMAPAPGPVYMAPQTPAGTGPLIVGILSLLLCPLLGPVAWIMGNSYEKNCRAMGCEPDGAGTAGKILGIIATVLLILGCGGFVLFFVIGMAGAASGM